MKHSEVSLVTPEEEAVAAKRILIRIAQKAGRPDETLSDDVVPVV
jgi:hypothetical protein